MKDTVKIYGINLLKAEYGKEESTGSFLPGLIVAAVIVVMGLLYGYNYYQVQMQENDIAKLEKRVKDLQAANNIDSDALKKSVTAKQSDMGKIRSSLYSWVMIFSQLEGSMPKGTTYSTIKADTVTISVDMTAPDFQPVADCITKLQKTPNLNTAKFTVVTKDSKNGQVGCNLQIQLGGGGV
ncbi:MAG: PilN domain-containing protein [Chitinophagales bacterium]